MLDSDAMVLAVVIGTSVTLFVLAPFMLVAIMGRAFIGWRARRRARRLQRRGAYR